MSTTGLTRCKPDTFEFRRRAVERVIRDMHERFDLGRLDETWPLSAMARLAIMSPYHFNRVFRQIAGIPPCQFLWALRLEAAKRLLLRTRQSVIDICFEVGYNSLGTFTHRFTRLVGVPPLRFRRLGQELGSGAIKTLAESQSESRPPERRDSGIQGRIEAPPEFSGLILVGLFTTPIPQGQPVSCALLGEPGDYQLKVPSDGRYYLHAAGLSDQKEPMESILDNSALRASSDSPLKIQGGCMVSGSNDLQLRPARLTDPPILVALPQLLIQRLQGERRKRKRAPLPALIPANAVRQQFHPR